jgi:hypothetical protein
MSNRIAVGQWVSSEQQPTIGSTSDTVARSRRTTGAISDDGQVNFGLKELAVASQAIQRFGPGRFALRRIGADAAGRWCLDG